MPKDTTSSASKKSQVKSCTCVNRYQDQRYGSFRRVMNYAVGKRVYRCTVCAALHS